VEVKRLGKLEEIGDFSRAPRPINLQLFLFHSDPATFSTQTPRPPSTPPPRPMMTLVLPQFQSPIKKHLSRPLICPPTDRISHQYSHLIGRLRNYLPHLPTNAQGQTRRLLHHLRLKTPSGQTAHLLTDRKPTTQLRQRQRNQDFRMPKTDYKTPMTPPQHLLTQDTANHTTAKTFKTNIIDQTPKKKNIKRHPIRP
jgi:hypothetical protein